MCYAFDNSYHTYLLTLQVYPYTVQIVLQNNNQNTGRNIINIKFKMIVQKNFVQKSLHTFKYKDLLFESSLNFTQEVNKIIFQVPSNSIQKRPFPRAHLTCKIPLLFLNKRH